LREYEYEFSPEPMLGETLALLLERGLVTQESLTAFLAHDNVRGIPGRRMLERTLKARRPAFSEGFLPGLVSGPSVMRMR
jgi:hypothetical protein